MAAIIAHDTREQAVQDARTDLHRLQQQAIEAGRDESRRLIKVSHIDHTTGQATYRPAGRLLRDWYLHCYTNALRDRLGSPAVTIDAQQIEDTTALLHRLTPNQTPLAALRAVAVLRDIADADAAHATVSIATTLHATAARRAIAHAPDSRFDADPLRVHVTRHWYLHSYLDHLQTATRSRAAQPTFDTPRRHQSRSPSPPAPSIRWSGDAAMTLTTRGRRPDRDHIVGDTSRNVAAEPATPDHGRLTRGSGAAHVPSPQPAARSGRPRDRRDQQQSAARISARRSTTRKQEAAQCRRASPKLTTEPGAATTLGQRGHERLRNLRSPVPGMRRQPLGTRTLRTDIGTRAAVTGRSPSVLARDDSPLRITPPEARILCGRVIRSFGQERARLDLPGRRLRHQADG